MDIKNKVRIGVAIAIVVLIATVGILAHQLSNARRDASIAEVNGRALTDTVRVYKTEVSNAASRFQLQQEINSDSIRKLHTALGQSAREHNTTQVAFTEAELQIDQLQTSLDSALTELTNVLSPTGRPERIAAFQFDTTFVQTDVVVVVPWDTAQGIEVELFTTYKPINIGYSLGCTPQHDAVATFESPPGIVIRPRMGTVDPTVCHPKSNNLAVTLFKPDFGKLLWSGAAFSAGYWLGKQTSSPTINVTQRQKAMFSILTVGF